MKVVSTVKLPSMVCNVLGDIRLEMNENDLVLPLHRLRQMLTNADGLIATASDKIDKALLETCSNLKIIVNLDSSVDNIDIDYASFKGIAVCPITFAGTQSTAELAFAMLMASGRNLLAADRAVRAGRFENGDNLYSLEGIEFYKKTLGILGMGNVGKAVAKIATGFSMDIIYNDLVRDENAELILNASYCSFDELLEWADFLVVAIPLDNGSKQLFTLNEFSKMKKSAVFINISKGQIVKEADLVEALSKNIIRSACLDVFENGSIVSSELKNLPNVLLTPNIASATVATRFNMASAAAEAIVMLLHGGRLPQSTVNASKIKQLDIMSILS